MSNLVKVVFYTQDKTQPIQTIAINGFEVEEIKELIEEYKKKSPSLRNTKNLKHLVDTSKEDA